MRYVGSRQLLHSWTFMDPNSWEVLFMDLALPVTPQGGCVCYTSHSGLLIFLDFSDSQQANMFKVTSWKNLITMLCFRKL